MLDVILEWLIILLACPEWHCDGAVEVCVEESEADDG